MGKRVNEKESELGKRAAREVRKEGKWRKGGSEGMEEGGDGARESRIFLDSM